MKRLTGSILLIALAALPAGAAPARARKPAAPKVPPKPAAAGLRADVLSDGKEAVLVDALKPEGPTVVLFYRPGVEAEEDLVGVLRKRVQPAQARDPDVQALRTAGWKDEEVFEASFI